jgi:hypothetical protein
MLKIDALVNKDVNRNNAKAPLLPSKINVNNAIFLLPVLKTFVAPMFPLPIFLISPKPDILVKIKPKGIEPIK